jgi:hypothetical protein
MINVLSSSVVDRRFEPSWGKTKDYNIGICCFSAKHTALRRKNIYTGWLRIRVICTSGMTYLPVDLFQ